MPTWAFFIPAWLLAVLMVGGIEFLSMAGLLLFRWLILPRVRMHDGVNDAISGTVQAIGVFYGVTVGLLAVGVWNTWSSDSDLVSKEAAAIGSLYRDVKGLPDPAGSQLKKLVKDYTLQIIQVDWPAQQKGGVPQQDTQALDRVEEILNGFEPASDGQRTRYNETMEAYNRMLQARALRLDAVGGGLNTIMWCVIWFGAAISIGVAYFFHLEDWRLHASLVALMAGFLAIVLYMIVINDRPFLGLVSIPADSYQLVVDTLMK